MLFTSVYYLGKFATVPPIHLSGVSVYYAAYICWSVCVKLLLSHAVLLGAYLTAYAYLLLSISLCCIATCHTLVYDLC